MSLQEEQIVTETAELVHEKLGSDRSGHDYQHIQRVVTMAKVIATNEADANKIDFFVVNMAAYLHDMADDKLNDDVKTAQERVREWLDQKHVPAGKQADILDIIQHMSFSDNLEHHYLLSLEGQIVQDADRLDAIGAVGIGRAFYYGGHHGDPIYDPEIKPRMHMTKEMYRSQSTVINHFQEKLLKLVDQLNTPTAKQIGAHRQKYMQDFLKEFKNEWEGNC
ncbi:HD domain-containing protein [Lactobacillus selangorensis]